MKKILLVLALLPGLALAHLGHGRPPHSHKSGISVQAPEIDASSGANAIALVTGFTLLFREYRNGKAKHKDN